MCRRFASTLCTRFTHARTDLISMLRQYSTCLRRQQAKRRKPLPPAPAIVGRGSAFTQDVWQNAALLVDKPQGWTSFDVCAKLRGALKTKKVRLDWS